ncbi:MAG: segregation/condensation protein A [Anaerolineales bacterium]|nr:segregation/condensation protein A [Anaerolineales bacterium]
MFKNVEDFAEKGTAKRTRFTITTTMFEGPLDLLLQLIEQAELDITRLALVEVTGPFLEYVRQIQAEKAEEVSSFLVIAARLMQIKSEALLPRPPDREPGEEDPSTELINQLITYKKFKEIARLLAERNNKGLRTYLRMAPPPKIEAKLEDGHFDLEDLMRAARTALRILEEKQSVDTVIRKPRVTMQDIITNIRRKLSTEGSATFSSLLGDDYTRVEVVVTFLALLELVRRFQIKAVQDGTFDDIRIVPTEDWDESEEIEIDLED